VFLPAALPLCVWLIRTFSPDARGHGTEAVIAAVHQRSGRVDWLVAPVKLAATVVTLAFGGSVGKEGPAAQIGAALTSLFADILRLRDEDRRRLVICGISAGFAAVFGTSVSSGSGGIVTPIFFIGATSGAALAPFFGAPTTFLAAVGLVAMLAAAANTPIAAAVMAMELLPGPEGVYAALAAATAFLMVGHRSVYASQKIGLSKSAGLDIQLGGPIGDVSRASVRIRKGSLAERVHQFGRARSSHKDADPDDSR
jgi:H+/Cl- antiporter ClcA